ncbi:MAG TPA: hypothetical protein PLP26_14045 [Ilumatobacteraceae bacterium]|nr:hypothetical protein [Ilumatobacteraceae bacterium]
MRRSEARVYFVAYAVGIAAACVFILVVPGSLSLVQRLPFLLVGLVFLFLKSPRRSEK